MAISVVSYTGGTYNGSGSKPSSSNSGTLTAAVGDIIMICCYSSRALAAATFDFHSVSSIDGSTLTFTKIINENYQYSDPNGGGFPAASCHCDVFIAEVTSTLAAQTWTSTMAAAGDTFINDSWCTVATIRGLDAANPLDTNAANPETATNVSTSSTAAEIVADITADESILFFLQFMHTYNAALATYTEPSGFTIGTGHFKSQSAIATRIDGLLSYKIFAAPQNSLTVSDGSSGIWYAAAIAFRGANAVDPNLKRSIATVIL